ncbi:MAG: porin [Burkholderiaceae bacterium]|nr:porin [Burkholderiaceae bacterium]
MKKSLLALAALTAFAGAASAQSSVTLYGRVDLSVAKNLGSDAKGIQNGSGSRLGVRGVEDLGGGLKALFNIEHRFNADTGAMSDPSRMWGGRSFVGLQGGFGQVVFGREYSTAFLGSQLLADPWGWDTIVASMNAAITGGGIAKVRYDSSATYSIAASGFRFAAQIAEATDTIYKVKNKPVNFSIGYAAGPLAVGMGYERTGEDVAETAKWMTIHGSYNLGMVKLGALYGTGDTAAGSEHRSYLLTAVAPMGAGELRASYGRLENKTANVDAAKGFALGYHYNMSKRTTLYVDVARNTALNAEKSGYDVGIKHNF